DDKIFIPKKNYYEGITLKFFKIKIKKAIKEDIFIRQLNDYNEIILIGSGKGVASVKTINQIGWKRKSLKYFKIFLKIYNSEIKVCDKYTF
ncbi:aminotransferase, partial [Candidatus Pelagibacter sp.]|nr:aminotransferase [Candidatus Pelagibacter sp.]